MLMRRSYKSRTDLTPLLAGLISPLIPPPHPLRQPSEVQTGIVQEYAAATAEAEMAEAKSVRQGEEAEAFRRIADEKRLLAYQLADQWTGVPFPLCCLLLRECK